MTKPFFLSVLGSLIVVVPIIMPIAVSAALVPCGTTDAPALCTFCDLFVLIHNIFNVLALKITPALSVVMFVVGGGALMFSGANVSLRETGKRIVTGTVIGVAIVLLSWVLVNTTINIIAGLGVSSEVAEHPPGFDWPWNEPNCVAPSPPST